MKQSPRHGNQGRSRIGGMTEASKFETKPTNEREKQMEYQITEDEFDDVYKPEKNRRAPNDAAWDGRMYETYGKEHERVRKIAATHPGRVWTLIDGGDGSTPILSGYHRVNRLGHFITRKAVPDGDVVLVQIEDFFEDWGNGE